MSYIALYRNYRPASFKDVAGQSHIITTLKNQVENNKTSHAYIFSGKRGIGKTTIARILAKAVNCLNPVNGEPCGECEHCKLINSNETPDIVELDAASNNGVEEIRNLLDKVNFLPSSLNKKVYIIDEVHMLSNSAFNALLKTLEEPPLHVMFILATTEPYKIPETILSRCQRFDFQQLTISEIVDKLKEIIKEENISISEEALIAIAESAEGGMRDAVNTLDQCSTYSEGTIEISDVDYLTGKVSDDYLIQLVQSFNKKDSEDALKTIDLLLNSGKDVSRIVTNLITFLKDTLLYKSASNIIEEKNIYNKESFKELSNSLDTKDIFFYIDVLMDTYNKIKYSNSSRIYLEVAILKIINGFNNVEELSNNLKQLESQIQEGNFGSGSSFNPELETKVSEMNLQLKKVVSELEKLDIRTFKEDTIAKFKYFENTQTSSPIEKYDDTRILNIINNIQNEVNDLKNIEQPQVVESVDYSKDIDELKKQISNIPAPVSEVKTVQYDDSKLEQKISSLENQINNLSNKLVEQEKQQEIQKRNNPFKVTQTVDEVLEEQKKAIESKLENTEQVKETIPVVEDVKVVESEPIEEKQEPVIEQVAEPTIVEKEPEIKEESIIEAPVVEVSKNQETTFIMENKEEKVQRNPYDVKILENLLHQSRQPELRNEMVVLKEKWSKLSSLVSIETSTVRIFKDGVLTANGKDTLLFVYPNTTYCNRLMSENIHQEAKQILKEIFNKDFEFLALPDNTWLEKRNEYYNQYRIGIVYPVLTDFNNPDLKVIEVKDNKSSIDKLLDFTVSIFGDDAVVKG